jgi:hypothetical protein
MAGCNNYQLMRINPSKSVHFIVRPLTFSLYLQIRKRKSSPGDFLRYSNSMKASHVKKNRYVTEMAKPSYKFP